MMHRIAPINLHVSHFAAYSVYKICGFLHKIVASLWHHKFRFNKFIAAINGAFLQCHNMAPSYGVSTAEHSDLGVLEVWSEFWKW